MRKRFWKSAQMSGLSPLPQASRILCVVSALLRRAVQKVAAELADIDEDGAVVLDDVVPEHRGGEALAQHHAGAGRQRRAGAEHAARRMVHRQAHVDAVVGAHPHRAVEAEHHALDAVVVEVRGLRQAGRAARVDEEALVLDGEAREIPFGDRRIGEAVELRVEPLVAFALGAVAPELRAGGDIRRGGAEALDQLRVDDHVSRLHDIDAVGERGAGQVRVEERDDAAGSRDAEPGGEVFRPVRHHQRDHVALLPRRASSPSAHIDRRAGHSRGRSSARARRSARPCRHRAAARSRTTCG